MNLPVAERRKHGRLFCPVACGVLTGEQPEPSARLTILMVQHEAFRKGVGGLLKSAEADEVIESIRRVAAGEAILPPDMVALVLDELANPAPEPKQLTEREIDILRLVAQGLGNKEIAGALHISENTVKTHVRHILEKLNLSNRAEAAAYAVRNSLIPKD